MKRITLLLLLIASFGYGQITPNQPTKFNNGIALPNAQNQADGDTIPVQNAGKINAYITRQELTKLSSVLAQGNSANGQKITGLLMPTQITDAATKGYVDDEIYETISIMPDETSDLDNNGDGNGSPFSTVDATTSQIDGDENNATISILDADGNVLDVLSVGWLNNASTLNYDDVNKEIKLFDENGDLQSTIPVEDFLSDFPNNMHLTNSTLQLRDSSNTILSEVELTISNIQGLNNVLSTKADDADVLHNSGNEKFQGIFTFESTNTSDDFLSITTSTNGMLMRSYNSEGTPLILRGFEGVQPQIELPDGNSDQWNEAYNRGDFRDFGLGNVGVQYVDNNDTDTFKDLGNHIFRGAIAPFQGIFNSNAYGTGLSLQYASDRKSQLLLPVNSETIQYRRMIGGVWQQPVSLWHSGDFSQNNINEWNEATDYGIQDILDNGNTSSEGITITNSLQPSNTVDIYNGTGIENPIGSENLTQGLIVNDVVEQSTLHIGTLDSGVPAIKTSPGLKIESEDITIGTSISTVTLLGDIVEVQGGAGIEFYTGQEYLDMSGGGINFGTNTVSLTMDNLSEAMEIQATGIDLLGNNLTIQGSDTLTIETPNGLGTLGQVLTRTNQGATWESIPVQTLQQVTDANPVTTNIIQAQEFVDSDGGSSTQWNSATQPDENQTIIGNWQFDNPVTGVDATAADEFVTLGQLDSRTIQITANLDFLTINSNNNETQTVNITGVEVGDNIIITPSALSSNLVYDAIVSPGGGSIIIRALNTGSSGTVNPPSQNYYITVIKNQ